MHMAGWYLGILIFVFSCFSLFSFCPPFSPMSQHHKPLSSSSFHNSSVFDFLATEGKKFFGCVSCPKNNFTQASLREQDPWRGMREKREEPGALRVPHPQVLCRLGTGGEPETCPPKMTGALMELPHGWVGV